MQFLQEHPWLAAAILSMGVLIFMRMVANEKHRRERYLELRMAAKLKQIENRNRQNDGRTPSDLPGGNIAA